MSATPTSNDKVLPGRLFLGFIFLTHSPLLLPSCPFLDPDSYATASREWHRYTPFGEHHPWNGNQSRPAIFCYLYPRSYTAHQGCPCFAHCPYAFLSRFRYSVFLKITQYPWLDGPRRIKFPQLVRFSLFNFSPGFMLSVQLLQTRRKSKNG